jgi:flavin reductase (DIM6/NTAB) family NADH-FMN oxidoreductase RutF
MSLKSIVRRSLGTLPQWAPVSIATPQNAISVSLECRGRSIDVTENQTVASLKPLTLAIGLDDGIDDIGSANLVFRDNISGREIGLVSIRQSATRSAGPTTIGLFDIEAASHKCLSWPRRHWIAWLQARAMRRDKNPHNFQMATDAVRQLMVFYICPRPVVLVSVSEAAHSNVFPMDLIGPLRHGCFTLALRNSSISIPAMVAGRRIVISSIGAEHKSAVYRLGEHHRKAFTDWNDLPFPTQLTQNFGIPAIASALQIRELAVEHNEAIGSHMFFVCRVVSDCRPANGYQLHHTAGFLQEFRKRHGYPFAAA